MIVDEYDNEEDSDVSHSRMKSKSNNYSKRSAV